MHVQIAQRLMAKVSKMHQQQSAAVKLQRNVRGWLARRHVSKLRATIEQVKAMAMVNVARLNMAEWVCVSNTVSLNSHEFFRHSCS
jgi:hypothetical protein